MTTFDDIQDIWNQQTGSPTQIPLPKDLIMLAEKNTKEIKAKHLWTIGVLAFSVLFFCWYMVVYTGFRFSRPFAGIGCMFFSLVLRLLLEQISYWNFRKIDIRADFSSYTEGITAFYKRRKKIHTLFTPVILGAYVGGFVWLLPVFKQQFSKGFYLYILLSGTIFFVVFAWLLIKQVKKEMGLLLFLRQMHP